MRLEGSWAYKIMRDALISIAQDETDAGLKARAAIRRIGEEWKGTHVIYDEHGFVRKVEPS